MYDFKRLLRVNLTKLYTIQRKKQRSISCEDFLVNKYRRTKSDCYYCIDNLPDGCGASIVAQFKQEIKILEEYEAQ